VQRCSCLKKDHHTLKTWKAHILIFLLESYKRCGLEWDRAIRSVLSAWKSWLFVQVENIYNNVFLRNNNLTKCTSWHKKENCWNALHRMCCFMKDQEWHCWAFTLSRLITTIIKKRIYYKSYSLRYKMQVDLVFSEIKLL
jgi:hypothetical protein